MNRMVRIFVYAFIFCLCATSLCFSANATEMKKEAVQAAAEQTKDSSEKQADSLKAAVVFFPQPKFEFDHMVEGEELLHDFVIMNKGTEVLQVQKVKTTCGCTTVSYPKEIPPGEEGKILMKVNTRGYGGRKLTKTIAVMTNDKVTPQSILTVSGNIEKFATITPSVLRLNGKAGDEMKSVIKIVPESKYPFSILKVRAQDGKNIKYELKEEKSASGGKEYSVTVENVKKDAGSYYDVLIIMTDSKVQPEIKINVMARLMETNSPSKTPLTGNNENITTPDKEISNRNPNIKATNSDNGTDKARKADFLEALQKMQQQNGTGVNQNGMRAEDPQRAQELRNKFEALIKQAQEQQAAKAK